MHAILSVMRVGFSTPSKPGAEGITPCQARKEPLPSLRNNSFMPNIRELSIAAAVFSLYHTAPRPPPLQARILKRDLQGLLDAIHRSKADRPARSRAVDEGKSLYKLHLSGFDFTAAEIAELEKHAWVLRVSV